MLGMTMKFAPGVAFRICCVSLIFFCATNLRAALSPKPDSWPPTNFVQPTVTAQMGDVGGKFFGRTPDPAKTRHYYIAAEPELWDYVPQGVDPICGKPLPPPIHAQGRVSKI